MSSSENIRNALQVLYKTYENVQKLINYTRIIAQEKTNYQIAAPKTLRWRSDNDTDGWLINDFILLFQNSADPDCESGNGWKNGPVYAMEICLGEKDCDYLPYLHLSKFEYQDMNGWSEGCSPSSHWVFYWPQWEEEYIDFVQKGDVWIGVVSDEKYSDKYWGLKKVTFFETDLMAVNSANLKEMIFGRFDSLRGMD